MEITNPHLRHHETSVRGEDAEKQGQVQEDRQQFLHFVDELFLQAIFLLIRAFDVLPPGLVLTKRQPQNHRAMPIEPYPALPWEDRNLLRVARQQVFVNSFRAPDDQMSVLIIAKQD